MSAPLSRGKKATFCAVLIAIALGAGELLVRCARGRSDLWVLTGRAEGRSSMADWAQLDAFCAYRARPGSYSQRVRKTVNEHGYISTPELSVKKPDGVTRLVFLGGSSTAGTGTNLPDEETWPWKVTELLREATPGMRFEFVNAALGGYSSFESYGRLIHRLRFFQPDIVIVYHGWNDMYYFDDLEKVHRWRTLSDGSWDLPPQRVAKIEPSAIDHFIWPSQLLVKVRVRAAVHGILGETASRTEPLLARGYDERCIEVWRDNLRLFESAAETLGFELFVCKQATLIVPELREEDRARCRYEYHGFDHEAHVRAFEAMYGVVDEEIAGDRVIDVRAASGVSANFYDHIHPTPQGTSQIAEIVGRALVNHLDAIKK